MANNRLFLTCVRCDAEPPGDGRRVYLGKYYPSIGWGIRANVDTVDQWFRDHRGCHARDNGTGLRLSFEFPRRRRA